jgi:hypothetical protein
MFLDLPRRHVRLFALLVPVGLTALGCGPKQQFAEVSGVVLLNGKPMPDALVEFLPDQEKGTRGPMSMGTTSAGGRFRLVSSDSDRRGGAVVGFHRVLIQDARSIPKARSDFSMDKPPENVPSRVSYVYGKAASTPLRQEVKPGPQEVTLEVTGRGGGGTPRKP